MRIALLEDDPSQIEFLSHWLSVAGHHVDSFERGEELLTVIRQQQCEVLILDWNLPEVTGIDILKRIRQTSKVPVLFCTSRDTQDDVVTALREGADDYLVKPPRRLELLARIESVARRARKIQANAEAFESMSSSSTAQIALSAGLEL
jgi:DNA-binding response OmpR family regulator